MHKKWGGQGGASGKCVPRLELGNEPGNPGGLIIGYAIYTEEVKAVVVSRFRKGDWGESSVRTPRKKREKYKWLGL
jgi:hypothetical protein